MPQIPGEHLKILQDKFSHLFEIDRHEGVITLKKGFKSKRTGKEIPQFQMVYIPSGEFMMGSEEYDFEKPIHKVKISQPFFMGKFPVVQELYEAVIGENPSSFKGKRRPVERVNWYEVITFCKELNKALGLQSPFSGEEDNTVADLYKPGFRLPTEAEWEYAARGGVSSELEYAGSNDVELIGWYNGNSNETKPVGLKMPNRLGLYDMNGNVYEWCLDWYNEDFYKKSGREDPYNKEKDTYRVLRGGSWRYGAGVLRVAARHLNSPDHRFSSFGARLCYRFIGKK